MKYRTVVCDPPWKYGDRLIAMKDRTIRGAESCYPCLQLHEIECLVTSWIAGNVEDRAHLFLWVTNSFIPEGFQLAESWGFSPKTMLTWVKPILGMGHYFRNNTEHVIFATRGNLRLTRKNCPTAFMAPVNGHSTKPDGFFRLVESVSPGPYLELFARSPRVGWDAIGNQLDPSAPAQIPLIKDS